MRVTHRHSRAGKHRAGMQLPIAPRCCCCSCCVCVKRSLSIGARSPQWGVSSASVYIVYTAQTRVTANGGRTTAPGFDNHLLWYYMGSPQCLFGAVCSRLAARDLPDCAHLPLFKRCVRHSRNMCEPHLKYTRGLGRVLPTSTHHHGEFVLFSILFIFIHISSVY